MDSLASLTIFRTGATRFWLVVMVAALCLIEKRGESQLTNTEEYAVLTAAHRDSLETLALRCEELQRSVLAEFTRKWIAGTDPSRTYFWWNPALGGPLLPKISDQTDQYWLSRFRGAKKKFAKDLFSLAEKMIADGEPGLAYRTVHQALFNDPQQQNAARVLGQDSQKSKIRFYDYRKREKDLPDGAVKRYETDYFSIYTTIDEKMAISAAKKLERWQAVWRQCFFDYWAPKGWLERRFKTDAKPIRRSKKFRVVLYRDRNEYIRKLAKENPGVEVSVGFYSPQAKTSYFYVGDKSLASTWVHELTHQLMYESIPVSSSPRLDSSIWAIEGIAIYMESLMEFETFASLGGQDAERLSYCRYHFYREGFWLPLKDLSTLSKAELVRHPQVAALYSFSGSVFHYLMPRRDVQQDLFKFLKLAHQGKNTQLVFGDLFQKVDFETDFKRFLKVDRKKMEASLVKPSAYKFLYLGNSDVDDGTVNLLKGAVHLQSLSLGQTRVTDECLLTIEGFPAMKFLDLERTRVTDRAALSISKLQKMEELDLTTTLFSDAGISRLRPLEALETLWLGGTRVSDDSIPRLLALPSLSQLDIRKSEVSAKGKAQLSAKLTLVE